MKKKILSNISIGFSIIKVCLNAIVLFIAIYLLVLAMTPDSFKVEGSGIGAILAAVYLAFAKVYVTCFICIISFVCLLLSLFNIRKESRKVFKCIYIGFACVYFLLMIAPIAVVYL